MSDLAWNWIYYVDLALSSALTRLVTAALSYQTEAIKNDLHRPGISHVIFDFDGTLSWLRSGWPDVMVQLFAAFLPLEIQAAASIRTQLRHDILSLNGKPSIHQMHRFREYALSLNVTAPPPDELLKMYLRRLDEKLQQRIDLLRGEEAHREQFVIAGAFPVLDNLCARGLKLFILSGTSEPEVKREAVLLGLQAYFGERIYGSTPGLDFSKKHVIDRIMHEEKIQGSQLLSFGDGPVEIEITKAVGGLAIGVASDEQSHGSGLIDEDKREHLLRAGADLIIPDYRNTLPIFDTILA